MLDDCRRLRENLESFMERRERERGGFVLPSGEGRVVVGGGEEDKRVIDWDSCGINAQVVLLMTNIWIIGFMISTQKGNKHYFLSRFPKAQTI